MLKLPNMEYTLKHYAHLGDAVWELFIREIVICHAKSFEKMHKLTTKFVNATFQAFLLENSADFFNDEENEILRRARNLPLSIAKRNNQNVHRNATAFEVIIGYFYLNDKARFQFYCDNLKKYLKFDEN